MVHSFRTLEDVKKIAAKVIERHRGTWVKLENYCRDQVHACLLQPTELQSLLRLENRGIKLVAPARHLGT